MTGLLKSIVIRVGTTGDGASSLTFNIRSKQLTASIDRISKFDVPRPVQLFKPDSNEIVSQKQTSTHDATSSQAQTPEMNDSKIPSSLFLEFFTAIEPTPNVENVNSGIANSIVSEKEAASILDKPENPENQSIHVDLANPPKRRGRPKKVSTDEEEGSSSCPNKTKNPKPKDLAKPIKRRGRPKKVSSDDEKEPKEQKSTSAAIDVNDQNDAKEVIRSTDDDDDDVMEEICAIFENKTTEAYTNLGLNEAPKSPRKNEALKSKADSPFNSEMIARKKVKSDSSQRKNLSVLSKLSSGLQDQIEPMVVGKNSEVSKKRKLSQDNRIEQPVTKKAKVDTNVVTFLDKNSNNGETKTGNTSDSTEVTSPPSTNGQKSCKAKKLLKAIDPNQKTILQYFMSRSNPL